METPLPGGMQTSVMHAVSFEIMRFQEN